VKESFKKFLLQNFFQCSKDVLVVYLNRLKEFDQLHSVGKEKLTLPSEIEFLEKLL